MDQRAKASDGKPELYFRGAGLRTAPRRVPWSSYYSLTALVSAAVFIIVWASLHDGYDETPVLIAAIAAGLSAILMTLFREIVLRRSHERALASRRLAHHLRAANVQTSRGNPEVKLSIARNDELLNEIRAKSEAAKVLGKLAEAHQEVFELCDEYLKIVSGELSRIRAGSPRLPALRKGSVSAAKRHRFHMLKWAELKARSFTSGAGTATNAADRIAAADETLGAVERAIAAYPSEDALTGSRDVLLTFRATARLKLAIDQAENAANRGQTDRAIGHYREALANLNAFDGNLPEREPIVARLTSEIERLSRTST